MKIFSSFGGHTCPLRAGRTRDIISTLCGDRCKSGKIVGHSVRWDLLYYRMGLRLCGLLDKLLTSSVISLNAMEDSGVLLNNLHSDWNEALGTHNEGESHDVPHLHEMKESLFILDTTLNVTVSTTHFWFKICQFT